MTFLQKQLNYKGITLWYFGKDKSVFIQHIEARVEFYQQNFQMHFLKQTCLKSN